MYLYVLPLKKSHKENDPVLSNLNFCSSSRWCDCMHNGVTVCTCSYTLTPISQIEQEEKEINT